MSFEVEPFARTLAENMPDAVIYADAEGVIRFWNRGAERVFGFPAEEAIGQSLDIIVPPALRERHWKGYDHTLKTGETRYGGGDLLSVPALRKDQSHLSVEFTIVPFHDAVGRMVGIAAVMRDVTARFEEMKALRRQAAGRGPGSSAPR
jgi:PAS domain S-box-containing protein